MKTPQELSNERLLKRWRSKKNTPEIDEEVRRRVTPEFEQFVGQAWDSLEAANGFSMQVRPVPLESRMLHFLLKVDYVISSKLIDERRAALARRLHSAIEAAEPPEYWRFICDSDDAMISAAVDAETMLKG